MYLHSYPIIKPCLCQRMKCKHDSTTRGWSAESSAVAGLVILRSLSTQVMLHIQIATWFRGFDDGVMNNKYIAADDNISSMNPNIRLFIYSSWWLFRVITVILPNK